MSVLKVGYNVFAGASQAGTNSGTPGVVQAEVNQSKAYFMKIQELNANEYWNNTTKAFQVADPAQADEIEIQGSCPYSGSPNTIRRLSDRIPYEALAGIVADGCKVTVYADGETPAADGVSITLAYKPDA
jgi:hypothetical protein